MEVIALWTQELMQEWGKRVNTRYPVLVVVPSGPGKITRDTIVEFASSIKAVVLDFEEKYSGRLSSFIGRADIACEIFDAASVSPVVVVNVEYFYDKWMSSERIDFIRHMLRRDGHRGIILVLHCDESLSLIAKEIAQNERGAIWNP